MTVGIDAGQFGLLVRGFTVLFAFGLVFIAFEAYRRTKRSVLLYVSLAFMTYMARDLIRLTEVLYPQSTSPLLLSMADILDLVTLLLIFFAVVKE
jgi:hypothetical protein